mgnify:CR=1 FL=1
MTTHLYLEQPSLPPPTLFAKSLWICVQMVFFISYAPLRPRYCSFNNDKGALYPLTGLQCLGIAVSCPGLFRVSSRLLAVRCSASLCCWLASSWCLLWRMGWRWCICFPWNVSSFVTVLICGRAVLIPNYGVICHLPWLRATLHEDRMRSRVPLFHKYYNSACLWCTLGR